MFFANKAKVIDLFHDVKPIPSKTFETTTVLGLSVEAKNRGLEASIEGEEDELISGLIGSPDMMNEDVIQKQEQIESKRQQKTESIK